MPMNPPTAMKTRQFLSNDIFSASLRKQPGFALVACLSLMILLSLVALGMLTLSSISLNASGRDSDTARARANARLSLMMALSQLQQLSGPDQRITMTADQRTSGDGSQTSAAAGRRQWTGVYRAWPATATTRPDPQFLSWLVSGQESLVTQPTTADASSGETVELVGPGSLGTTAATAGSVRVPVTRIAQPNGRTARLAWWVGDQGVKAALSSPAQEENNGNALVRSNLQAAPPALISIANTGGSEPFAGLTTSDERMPRVTSWQQAALLTASREAPKGLFHDLAPFSTGMLTNVRSGGFRKDLSMHLERTSTNAPRTALYQVRGENGINLQELWSYYNLYKDVQRRGTGTFTTGGRFASGTPYLTVRNSPSECESDDGFFFKHPVIINYQMVFSFEVRPITTGGTTVNSLRLVADPIITLWNPLDIPVVVPTGSFLSVKYWQYPYDILIRVNNGPVRRSPMISTLSGATTTANTDQNYLTLRMGNTQQLVFRPGEIVKLSQKDATIVRETFNRNLDAGPGFQFNGGLSLPLRDQAGATINLTPTDSISYEVVPNNLTAGKTSSSGNSLYGGTAHTRHFSTTHHETYVGHDRTSSGPSLGYGGMFIDWDFGDRRLRPNETRGETQSGTKPSAQRIYADRSAYSNVFRRIPSSETRPYTFAELNGRKAPFMILSFEAKTEEGSDRGTRSLARFNPAAKMVDFYNLSPQELDMLPYEFRVEALTSWRNRSLEVSTNGNAFFGGGMNAEFGSSFVTTHTVPQEPLVSLAAFQHAFANGFEMSRPKNGYAILNSREPLLPQISHAIGNSLAPSVLPPDRTEGQLAVSAPFTDPRPVADHSYWANQALFDDWFLSGISPQTQQTYTMRRDQRRVATEFLSGEAKLPVTRYFADIGSENPTTLANSLFSGSLPSATANEIVASLMRVDGLFNVNSTSVEAWKTLLSGLQNRPLTTRDSSGAESVVTRSDGRVTVANLQRPDNAIVDGSGSVSIKDDAQWTGHRALTVPEIDALSRAIVREVRKRGPFLSLADFVNRRVGTNKDLARAGAMQNALDAADVPINSAFRSGSRAVSSGVAGRLAFPEAEEGAKSFGMPGYVKQADLLTPLAPVLSARSDSFIIRAYGEAVGGDGRITARAWCEAVVERSRHFVDPQDPPNTAADRLTREINRNFGRRYEIVAFRWLHPEEV